VAAPTTNEDSVTPHGGNIIIQAPQARATAAALAPEVIIDPPPAVHPPRPRWCLRALLAVAANVAADIIVEVGRRLLDLKRAYVASA
jgi:hypothetical protein